jgi:polyisoprenyl-phosphate glycosyltransferase
MQNIDIVIPFFNEELSISQNLTAIISVIKPSLQKQNIAIKIIAVNDGSTDSGSQKVLQLAEKFPEIELVQLVRNFGKEAAILAGLACSKGNAAVVMDSDLQHPPELVAEMTTHWQSGFLVVQGFKEKRGVETFASRIFAKSFYKFFSLLSGVNIENHSDFKLLDKSVVNFYLSLAERQRFFRGIIAWYGFHTKDVPFSVPERSGDGGSKWSKFKLYRYAILNLTSFSSVPLRIVTLLGFGVMLVGFVFTAIALVQKLNHEAVDGFTTVICLMFLSSGGILSSLGIIGHYVGRIYDEVKARPTYVPKPKSSSESTLTF